MQYRLDARNGLLLGLRRQSVFSVSVEEVRGEPWYYDFLQLGAVKFSWVKLVLGFLID